MRSRSKATYREYHRSSSPKPYGFWAFMGDIFMTFVTSGLWMIWIFVREMRKR